MTKSIEDIPIMAAHNDLIARVLTRNNIPQVDLADECQLSESTISRIISGDRIVSPDVIRALYKLTRDPEMITFIFGTENFSLIELTGDHLTKSQAERNAVIACSKVLGDTGTNSPSHDDGIKRIATIDKAMTCLAALRTKIIPNTYTDPKAPKQRIVQHKTNGQLVSLTA